MAANTLARFDTNFGAFTVELYDSIAPLTVANFLGYVNSGLYNNTFFHRLVAGFVLQGGGYSDMTGTVATVPQNPPVVNEYQASDPDAAGTIAMAKLGGDPNSATDQFFFNLVDNTTTLGPSNNGGFTVFGRVVQGWNIVQAIAALPIVNAGSAFGQLPVVNYTSGQPITPSNLVQLQDVVVSGFGITAKLTDLGGVTSKDIVFENAAATARIQYLAGASTVEGFQFGNTIDLLGTTGATLSGNTVSTATGSLTLSSAPAGYASSAAAPQLPTYGPETGLGGAMNNLTSAATSIWGLCLAWLLALAIVFRRRIFGPLWARTARGPSAEMRSPR